MRSVLLAGCGYLGGRLAEALLRREDRVWVIKRSLADVPEGAELLQADLDKCPPDLGPIPEITHVVYSLSADEYSDAAYQAAYVSALKNLLEALAAREFRGRFVFTSSTSVYAQSNAEWIDESSETLPKHFSGARILEAEELLRRSKVGAVILRLSGIYGPGRQRIVEQVKSGSVRLSKEEGEFTNRIHRDDCVAAIEHLLQMAEPEAIYLASDHEPVRRTILLKWLADRLGVELAYDEAQPESALRGNKRCSSERLRASGFAFLYPSFREGYGAMVPDIRESFGKV